MQTSENGERVALTTAQAYRQQESARHKRKAPWPGLITEEGSVTFYKMVDSPVGRLTLVATDEGLAAILWENDRPGRVRLNIEAEDDSHPVLVETERQLAEYFAGQRTGVRR